MKFSEIDRLVGDWANDKGLREATAEPAQLKKLLEEVGELVEAVMLYNSSIDTEHLYASPDMYFSVIRKHAAKVKDSIGDTMVLLSNIAAINSFTLKDCYEHAYNEIKDRTGKTVNGEFIKDAP